MRNDKVRNSNYELMRIVSMFMIVLFHVITHGKVIQNCQNETLKTIMEVINFFIIVHVNSFILITGYFNSEKSFKQSKVWALINSCFFYKLLIIIILTYLGYINLSKVYLMNELFIFNLYEYWFIKVYIFLYILSPFLNILIKNMKKNEFKIAILVMFLLFSILPYITGNKAFDNNGFTLYNFIFLYFIGAYLKKYPIEKSYIYNIFTKKSYQLTLLFSYIFLSILNFLIYKTSSSLLNINTIFDEIFGNFIIMKEVYSNPIIILQSISFFLLFGTFNFKNKFINKISKLTIGIYLIHDNDFMRCNLYKWLKINNGPIYSLKFIIYVFIVSILIFVICSIIEYLRQLLFKKIYNFKFSKKLTNKYYNFLNDLKRNN